MKCTIDEATRLEIRESDAYVAILRALAQLPDKESRSRVLEAATHIVAAETLMPGSIEAAASKVNALRSFK